MKKNLLLLSIIAFVQTNGQIITTVAGNGTGGYSGDGGNATAAQLYLPNGMAVDGIGNLYIADYFNNRIRKINTSGIITTVAGNGTAGFSGDSGLAISAQLNWPDGVAIDAAGNLFIADENNNRIRKVNSAGIITTVAGYTNTGGFSGDGGQATSAKLNQPGGITLDAVGNLYFVDYSNYRVRKVTPVGIITTVAGNGTPGFGGDGGLATLAQINANAVAVDTAGNLYLSEDANNRIRKVNSSGIINTYAGNGVAGFSGDGGQASAAGIIPTGVTFDNVGNLYIADAGNNRVRMVNSAGIITTIAGTGVQGYSGDYGCATAAELYNPAVLVFNTSGTLYIADELNNCIRAISTQTCAASININQNINNVLFFPNPASDQFFIDANTNEKLTVELYDVNSRRVVSASINDKSNIDVAALDNGIYTLTIKTGDKVISKKLAIVR